MTDAAWNVIVAMNENGTWCYKPCGVRAGCGCADIVSEAITAAIAAEREACAKIAKDFAVLLAAQGHASTDSMSAMADRIADAIRARGGITKEDDN